MKFLPADDNRRKSAWTVAISTIIGIAVIATAYFSNASLLGAAWLVTGLLLTFSLTAIAILAGFVVVKSLFLIAAELSLIIFLAQSYCAAPARTPLSDSALRSLILLGVIYVSVAFVQSLYSVLHERYQKLNAGEWTLRKIIINALFVIFAVIFLWQIYLVMDPIIRGLCVYNP